MVGNTGTYLDTPFHRFEGGSDLSGLALDDVADLPGLCIDAPGPEIGPEAVDGLDLTGKAVLFATGWDRHWGTDSYGDPSHSFVSSDLVDALVDGGAVLVGIDSVNIDDTRGWGTAGSHRPARRRHPGSRASHRPRSTGRQGLPVLRGPTQGEWFRDFPGQGVCSCRLNGDETIRVWDRWTLARGSPPRSRGNGAPRNRPASSRSPATDPTNATALPLPRPSPSPFAGRLPGRGQPSGFAWRLSHQAGSSSAQPFIAIVTTFGPSSMYPSITARS